MNIAEDPYEIESSIKLTWEMEHKRNDLSSGRFGSTQHMEVIVAQYEDNLEII
jgi:hypothetical protein